MKRTSYLLFAILLIGSFVLGACTSQTSTAPQAPVTQAPAAAEEITIEYWVFADYGTGAAGDLQNTFIKEFEASHPGVKIVMSAKNDDELSTGVLTAAASKTLPDLYMQTEDMGAQDIAVNAMENLYGRWMAMPETYRSQFNPAMIADMTPQANTMWGMPYTGFSNFLYRNLTVLKAAGIDPNEPVNDWDTFLAQMQKIKDAGYDAMGTYSDEPEDTVVYYSGVASEAEWGIDFVNKKTLINPDKFAQMMEFLVEARKYGPELGNRSQGATDLFLANKLAFVVSGPWKNVTFQEAKKNTGLEFDFIVNPGATADNTSGARGTELIALAPNSTHKDIAWEFVTYICDEPQMTRWATLLSRYNSNLVTMSTVKDSLLDITGQAAKSALLLKPPTFKKAYPGNYFQTILDTMAEIEAGQTSPIDGANAMIQKLNEVIAAEE